MTNMDRVRSEADSPQPPSLGRVVEPHYLDQVLVQVVLDEGSQLIGRWPPGVDQAGDDIYVVHVEVCLDVLPDLAVGATSRRSHLDVDLPGPRATSGCRATRRTPSRTSQPWQGLIRLLGVTFRVEETGRADCDSALP